MKHLVYIILSIQFILTGCGNVFMLEVTNPSQIDTVIIDTVIIGDGYRYEGQWPEGEGVWCSNNSGLIIGTFKNSVPEGRCINWRPNGERYWGDFHNGRRNGHGTIFRGEDIVVTGDMKNGKQHGCDTVYRKDGSVLIGMYENGKLHETVAEYDGTPAELRKVKPIFPDIRLTQEQKDAYAAVRSHYKEMREKKRSEKTGNPGEVKPRFMGMEARYFSTWVNGQLKYPREAKKVKAEGCTVLQFEVTVNGEVKDVRVLKSSGHYALDNEALRVVRMSPEWNPGTQNGVPKEMSVTFPVIFKLN